ncbi:hypothetical protein HAX54_017401, partial [Datura stramonium]|nr:hypothetical protein [Datura stramonium]
MKVKLMNMLRKPVSTIEQSVDSLTGETLNMEAAIEIDTPIATATKMDPEETDVSAMVTANLTFNIMCIKDIQDDHGQEFDPEEDSCHDYHQVFRTLVQDYIQKFHYATELTIGTWFTENSLWPSRPNSTKTRYGPRGLSITELDMALTASIYRT